MHVTRYCLLLAAGNVGDLGRLSCNHRSEFLHGQISVGMALSRMLRAAPLH